VLHEAHLALRDGAESGAQGDGSGGLGRAQFLGVQEVGVGRAAAEVVEGGGGFGPRGERGLAVGDGTAARAYMVSPGSTAARYPDPVPRYSPRPERAGTAGRETISSACRAAAAGEDEDETE
jgi:hypothetical protein